MSLVCVGVLLDTYRGFGISGYLCGVRDDYHIVIYGFQLTLVPPTLAFSLLCARESCASELVSGVFQVEAVPS